MKKRELESRTKRFAVDVIRFVNAFERSAAGRVIANQLLKSATSVGANYREANRAVSRRDFAHKITLVEKEASETQYWLEICLEAKIGDIEAVNGLLAESTELVAIFTSIGRSMRAHDRRAETNNRNGVSEPTTSEYTGRTASADDGWVASLLPSYADE
jgi:four helix bundle protein